MADLSVAKNAALVIPPQSVPFKLPPHAEPTCNAALARPWELGDWTNTALNPFDNVNLLGREVAALEWCKPANTTATAAAAAGAAGGPAKLLAQECSTCDYGYILSANGSGPPQCRDAPVCNGQLPGKQCTMSALTPWLVIPCEACISSTCSPYSGMSSCNEL